MGSHRILVSLSLLGVSIIIGNAASSTTMGQTFRFTESWYVANGCKNAKFLVFLLNAEPALQ
jgi:hypothetical protein